MEDLADDGYVNLALRILVQAKQDAVNGWADTEIWHTFQREYNTSNPGQDDALDVAQWVMGYVVKDWRSVKQFNTVPSNC